MTIKSVCLHTMLLAVFSRGPMVLAQPAPAAGDVPAFTAKDETDARRQLGERFCELALTAANATQPSKSALLESAALIEGATRMSPSEPRFWRLLAVTREKAGDLDGAVNAWEKYRAIPSCQDDEIAQIAVVDLYLSQMQANDAKLRYLKTLLDKPIFTPRVKAHIAGRAVPLIDQRSRNDALAMLAEARKFYPLPEITLLEWQMLPADARTPHRLKALLNIVRSNPTRADAVGKVADMLAGAGFSDESLGWYSILMEIHTAQGTEPAESSVINYLTERYRTGESTYAAEQLDRILQVYPDDKDILFLRLTIGRSDENAQLLKQAQQVFLKDANLVCNAIFTGSFVPATQPAATTPSSRPAGPATLPSTNASTTQPGEQPAPPVAKAVQSLQQLTEPRFKNALIASLSDLAWFELYYDHNAPAATPIVNALKDLLPPDSVALRRLVGWLGLVAGDEAGMKSARDIFAAQETVDPLSALGLFRLEDKTNNRNIEAAAVGTRLASEPKTGVLGAILFEAIKGRGFKGTANPDTAAIKAELGNFPKDWLQVVHNPSRFYAVRVDPINVGHQLGDPMLATVTVENNCLIDLTIGDYGLLKPMVIFDAQINGANAKNFPGVAQDRLMGRQVLGPGESFTQEVRIDQGELGDAMRVSPGVALYVSANIVTNPGQIGPSHFRAEAGGYARRFGRSFARMPALLATEQDRRVLFEKMAHGTPVEKVFDVQLLAAYVGQYAQAGATNQQKDISEQFANEIGKYRADPAPSVSLWASYTFALLLAGKEEQRAIGDILQG